jgi:hypothetical protein
VPGGAGLPTATGAALVLVTSWRPHQSSTAT